MRSDWRHAVVDLTNDSDDDDVDNGPLLSLPKASYLSTTTTRANANPAPPLPGSIAQKPPINPNLPSASQPTPRNGMHSPSSTSRPSTMGGAYGSKERNGGSPNMYIPMPGGTQNGTGGPSSAGRAAKRMKVSAPEGLASPLQGLQQPSQPTAKMGATARPSGMNGGLHRWRPGTLDPEPHTKPASSPRAPPVKDTQPQQGVMKKIPSVQYMNEALKTNGAAAAAAAPISRNIPTGNPRPLEIGRVPEVVQTTDVGTAQEGTPFFSQVEGRVLFPDTRDTTIRMSTEARDGTTQTQPQRHPTRPSTRADNIAMQSYSTKPNHFSATVASPRGHDNDSVMSDASSKPKADLQRPIDRAATTIQPLSTPNPILDRAPTAVSSQSFAGNAKFTNQFTQAQDHYLIFLKEVKAYTWKRITAEYNAEFPHRNYSTLQSRYSTNLNKRDRSQDPQVLSLPSRFAAEATIDWNSVHANSSGPRARHEPANSSNHQESIRTRPSTIRQTTEQDDSSGGDSGPRRERPSRAKRVNYTWPKGHGPVRGHEMEDADEVQAPQDDLADVDDPMRSETEEATPIPDTAVTVDNEPLDMRYDVDDAKLALNARKGPHNGTQELPYLTSSQRLNLQSASADWDWEQLSSRSWQGSVLHVDLSPSEIAVVKKAVAKIRGYRQKSRHTTAQRKMRALLADLTEPKLLRLVDEVRRQLPCRTRISITAFIEDARTGRIADASRIQRLSAAKPQDRMSTTEKMSTSTMIRQRELGQHSRRGWSTASKPITYQIRNKHMDSLGPVYSWTGASSDIHTVAWAPDGECFAAGSVAVDDPDSMQYNRPNNLLYGNLFDGSIHELGEHARKREKTSTGANSTHAMFVSQDPKLYTTVSSVAFAPSGRLMYSAGYDETICVWHTNSHVSEQPVLGAKIRFKAQIDMMAVNHNHDGVLATAAKITGNKAVRLLTLDEADPSKFGKENFYSTKAVSRSDLRILPTALQFEPIYGNHLLAGFGANVRDFGYDMTGDVCLWDVTTQAQIPIHGSNRNVFDVEFNPNRRYMPLFAVGCVAGPNVNRGTRSVLRLYDEKVDKFTCPLEIECKALDMNDVVWCPYDENLIAAGCTNGRAYIWDARWPNDPIRTLSHGRSLMPLQDGVAHELTDTGIRFLSWGENATRLYSGSSDGVVKVWDITRAEENTFIKDLVKLDSGIMSGAFSPDKSKLVIGEVNGSVNVLEVGRDDCSIKHVEKMRFVPYDDEEPDHDSVTGEPQATAGADSGIAEGNYLLQSGQVQLAPLGGLPIRQIVQGPSYTGPFDSSIDAPFLRQQALDFQLSMSAQPGSPQCDIPACKANIVKVTNEEIGDSGRSADRIPDELRRQWKAIDSNVGVVVPGKSKCTYCTRPARPPPSVTVSGDSNAPVLCERCAFACFRCGATNSIAAATTTVICDACAGIWDVGALGYECMQQPLLAVSGMMDVPLLKKSGKEAYRERLEDMDMDADAGTTFGDEMNALTEYYFGLALDGPDSPPL
ncbi:hypothetical protein N0V83_005739 [Neocucurbitaria cava]|uniref:WD40 repeat-like protein n=1 Tax=Neocucurbitaria cava TaxID=798079 RepID=A0A9W8Y7P9_9PLEO|nr:hypothetical protein N0V83_005739 [Neocucurbitaria cava]